MKNIGLTIVLVLLAVFAMAQPDVAPKELRDGQYYYVHIVKKKQTAYGISKMYDVSVPELYDLNPAAKSGLKVGQKLYLPIKEKHTDENIDVPVDEATVGQDISGGEGLQEEVIATNTDTTQLVHVVQPKETLYGIAKKYGVPLEDINRVNPGLSAAIKVGDKIIVPLDNVNKNNVIDPIVKNPINSSVNPEDSVIVHKVKRGETLYALTKLYGVTEQSIKDANDGLLDGLKKGEKIRIVVKRKLPIEVVLSDTLALESLKDSIVNQDVVLPADAEYGEELREVYEVAVMLPFMFEKNTEFRAKCPPYGDCPFYGYTLMSLNYYNGFLLAVDSLKKAGLNVNIHTYDTKNSLTEVKAILQKPEIQNIDLIFGPLFPVQIREVSAFAKSKGIQNVIPLPVTNKALYKNPSVSKFISSKPTQVKAMGTFVADSHAVHNVIVVKNYQDKKDTYYCDEFLNAYHGRLAEEKVLTKADSAYVVKMSSSSNLKSVESKMRADKLNVIVVPSVDVGHVSNFITKLSNTTNRNPYSRYQVVVFGLEDWIEFETIDEKYKNRFNLHLPVSGHIDYKSKQSIDFIIDYRIKYGAAPNKYAYAGFDAGFVNLKGLFLYGVNYAKTSYSFLDQESGMYSGSKYREVQPGSGFENQAVYMVRYNNYKIEVVK